MSDYVQIGYVESGYVASDASNLYVEDGYFLDGYVDNSVVTPTTPTFNSGTWSWNQGSKKNIKKPEQDVVSFDEEEALLILLSM